MARELRVAFQAAPYATIDSLDNRAFLLDLLDAEIFRRERIEQQKTDSKRVRKEIRERIGP
jgi:hypothetical protein